MRLLLIFVNVIKYNALGTTLASGQNLNAH